MKALILNSGMGKRMGGLTSVHPKCMTEIDDGETILGRQLKILNSCGITQVIMTTGLFDKVLTEYCNSLDLPLEFIFVQNPDYDKTNYIYSIYLAREYLQDDILLLHGDLVFEEDVINSILCKKSSCMAVSSILPLPPKDFKAVIEKGLIRKIGIEYFDNAITAQPLYKLNKDDWNVWMNQIIVYCNDGQVTCYAENAFNDISDKCSIYPMDFNNKLCAEIDTPEDLSIIKAKIKCFGQE